MSRMRTRAARRPAARPQCEQEQSRQQEDDDRVVRDPHRGEADSVRSERMPSAASTTCARITQPTTRRSGPSSSSRRNNGRDHDDPGDPPIEASPDGIRPRHEELGRVLSNEQSRSIQEPVQAEIEERAILRAPAREEDARHSDAEDDQQDADRDARKIVDELGGGNARGGERHRDREGGKHGGAQYRSARPRCDPAPCRGANANATAWAWDEGLVYPRGGAGFPRDFGARRLVFGAAALGSSRAGCPPRAPLAFRMRLGCFDFLPLGSGRMSFGARRGSARRETARNRPRGRSSAQAPHVARGHLALVSFVRRVAAGCTSTMCRARALEP